MAFFLTVSMTFFLLNCDVHSYINTGQYKGRTADCGLPTADYGLRTGYKIWTRYKTRTRKYGLGIKHGQGIKRGLRTADWV